MKKQILFASFEATPFIKTGGLGDVGGSLPGAITNDEFEVRVILPKLSMIPAQYRDAMETVAVFEVPLGWRVQYCGIQKLEHRGVTFYFVDNEFYFKRDLPYGYGDDAERFAYFSKAILESLQYLPDFFPDIIHCHDWHTAPVPVLLREQYMHIEAYRNIKTIFTVHNLKFQGIFPYYTISDVLALHNTPAAHQMTYGGDCINYMQGALLYADRLSTVSPTYANEICTPYFGENMDGIFRDRRSILSGILNGIDTTVFDPENDADIIAHFNKDDLSGKAFNKKLLQAELGLAVEPDVPMLVLISRLTEQKGLDLLVFILEELLQEDLQLVVLGVGEQKYEDAFRYYAGIMPSKVSACMTFSEALSHKLYASADMLLMPSQFEPCGLSQMIAMRYGTLPVVRETGGLKDSVLPYNQYTGEGNGFSFANYNAHELLFVLKDALALYHNNKPAWHQLMMAAMSADFSWNKSAEKYRALYLDLLGQ